MYSNQEKLTIAGMGATGKSLAAYLDTSGVVYSVCDDNSKIYDGCKNCQASSSDYVFKSPGMPYQSLGLIKSHSHIINDVELFTRLCKRPLILVTGTNGKSTVVALVEHILNECGIHSIACGNNGIPVFDAYLAGPDIYIIELSSYQLENIKTLFSYSSVLLNVGIDHIDRYENIDAYQLVKEGVYKNSAREVYPVDANDERSYGDEIYGYEFVDVGNRNRFHISGEDIFRNGELFISCKEMQLEGRHNYLNACAALSLCYGLCKDDKTVKEALLSFRGLDHRLEIVCTDSRNRVWINDSKSTNVHAAKAALSSYGKDINLIIGGRGKGESFVGLFNEFSDAIKSLTLYGESAGEIFDQAGSIENKKIVADVPQAVSNANAVGCDDSVILFTPACASFDQYADYKSRGDDFRKCVIEGAE